jgi:2-methylcitrate dehydratase PrpD
MGRRDGEGLEGRRLIRAGPFGTSDDAGPGMSARAVGRLPLDAKAAGVSRRLADFAVASRWDDVPEAVRHQAVRSIVNGFGTALGGSCDAVVIRLMQTLEPFSSGATATVIGHRTRLDMPTAAFLNAVAVNVFDFDDTHEKTIIHPTAPVLAALFAVAEQAQPPVTGAALLHAFVIGVEIECRLGNAVSPGHYERGYHITATCGVFGAAAAVGKLIGLGPREMLWAFGNASAQASGLVETLGFMAKSVGVGNAARNGVLSALMARHGVEGPPCPLEGPRGFLNVMCDQPDAAALEAGLGSDWQLARNMLKPYPCGVVLNPVIDAALAARADPAFAIDSIESIRVSGHPLLKARADRPSVTSGREAQVSAQHAIAVALLRGTAGAADFSDAAVSSPAVMALRNKVAGVDVDAASSIGAARLTVTLAGGAAVDVRIGLATGSRGKPLSDADVVAKFEALAAFGCPDVDTARLSMQLWRLQSAPDAGAVMAAARPL